MSELKAYHGYEVSSDGQVYSCKHNWRGHGRRAMRQQPNFDGYPSVRLTIGGKRKRLAVHRLVAELFLGPKPTPHHQVRHLDGSRTNNKVSNLAWGTVAENAQDRVRHGRQFIAPWDDPEYRRKTQAAMRASHALKRKNKEGRYANLA